MRIGIITRQESDTETPRQAGFSCLVSYWSLAINNSPQKSAGKPEAAETLNQLEALTNERLMLEAEGERLRASG